MNYETHKNILGSKWMRYFICLLIIVFSTMPIILSTYTIQIRYIMIIFTIVTTFLSVAISQYIFKFFLKIFLANDILNFQIVINSFFLYLLLNTILVTGIQRVDNSYIVNFITIANPLLIIYLMFLMKYFKKNISLKKVINFDIFFYLFNFIFALIGVMVK